MEKVYLQKIEQNKKIFYSFVWSAVKLNRLRTKYKPGEIQDIQRPYIENKVKQISEYVAGKSDKDNYKYIGLIPNSPIIVFGKKIPVHTEKVKMIYEDGTNISETKYYVILPSNEEEAKEFEGQIKIIDGQHRIIAFDEQYIDDTLEDSDNYLMNFIAFADIMDREKRELFMVTNEKQDKVKANLLIYIKKDLGLLADKDEFIYDVIDLLNQEDMSPLKGRIMFGAEKISKGYAENQVSKIIDKYGVLDFYYQKLKNSDNGKETLVQILINYLNAWEQCTKLSYSQPGKDTFTKISGLRYVLCAFGSICDHLFVKNEKMTKENFVEIIKKYPKALKLENVKCVFNDDEELKDTVDKERGYSFRSEGGIISLAKDDVSEVIKYLNSENKEKGYSFL